MTKQAPPAKQHNGEEGYLLLGLVVVCFLLLLALGVAAPRVAKQLERDREVEAEHRAQEYVHALRLFYLKNSRFPTSVDELLGKNPGGGMSFGGSNTTVRYLRQQYKDPLTGGDFRPIHFGEAKTEVKGFFGEPLQGMPVGNLGSAAGMVSNLGPSVAGSFGSTSSNGNTSPNGNSPATGASPTSGIGATGTSPTGTPQTGTTGSTDSSSSSTSATTFQGSKGAIIGFGSNAKGHGQVEWNGSENIEDWEFLYDPRVELLKAKVSIFGGSPAANGSGSLGSGFAPVSGTTGLGGTPGTPTAAPGGAANPTGNNGGTPSTPNSGAPGGSGSTNPNP